MKHVTVSIGHVTTIFQGEEIEATVNDDGSLVISKWQTNIETGSTIFAKGSWNAVSISEYLPLPAEQNA